MACRSESVAASQRRMSLPAAMSVASSAGVACFADAVMVLLGEESGEADVGVLAGDVGDLEDSAADDAACGWEGWG